MSANRDLTLQRLEQEWMKRRNYLTHKMSEMSKQRGGGTNQMLQPILEEYSTYEQQVANEKQQQQIAMRKLLRHISQIIKSDTLTGDDLKHAQQQYNYILNELDMVTGPITASIRALKDA